MRGAVARKRIGPSRSVSAGGAAKSRLSTRRSTLRPVVLSLPWAVRYWAWSLSSFW